MMGKKPPVGSALVWSALATVALQVSVLAVLGEKPPGPVISQALLAVMAVLAATACLRASLRSIAFARSFWRLASLAFFIWAVAQTLGTYQQYFAPFHPQAVPRGSILYFFSFAPVFAALFLTSGVRSQSTRWEFYLDFLQILIVSATFYFLFLNVSWWQLSDAEWVSRRVATVNLRNFLLSAGFVLRMLYFRLGLPMMLYSVGFWAAKHGISLWANRFGSWYDLGWSLPFLLIVYSAEDWKAETTEEDEPRKGIGYVPVLLAFLSTLSLVVVFIWLRIVRGPFGLQEAYLLAASLVGIFICFFSRLALTLRRQQRTLEQLQSSELRYRSLFERNLAGVFRTTMDGKYLDCNETYARIYGYASREAVLASYFPSQNS